VSVPNSPGSRPPPEAYLVVGCILGPHGLRGDVRVRSYTEPPESLLQHRVWLLRTPAGAQNQIEVLKAFGSGTTLRVALAGINDRNAAAALRGCEILLERAALPAPREHEFYQDDLVGFSVRNTDGVLLGQLAHFLAAPAGTLMVVTGARERWLPAQAPRLRRIDTARREIVVDWPEDL
jgi:16S rRNA processing protein RimM